MFGLLKKVCEKAKSLPQYELILNFPHQTRKGTVVRSPYRSRIISLL